MSGKELIEKIEGPNYKKIKGQNIMGCGECFYDPDYLIYSAFKEANKLDRLSQLENIDDLSIVAGWATEVFY